MNYTHQPEGLSTHILVDFAQIPGGPKAYGKALEGLVAGTPHQRFGVSVSREGPYYFAEQHMPHGASSRTLLNAKDFARALQLASQQFDFDINRAYSTIALLSELGGETRDAFAENCMGDQLRAWGHK